MVIMRQRPVLPELVRRPELADVPTRFGRLLDEVFQPMRTTADFNFVPVVDIVDKDEQLVLTAELPGIKPEDVHLEIDNNVLTLKGEKSVEHEEKTERYRCWERSFGTFERSFAVPSQVDVAKIRAEFRNGVLEVHMPKTAQARARKIEIANK
jgi:HSP20 family protein